MRTALLNRKGGVGKSAVAIGLATTWAQRGQRVLLVDLDPQGTATRTLDVWGVEPDVDAVLTGQSLAGATHKLGDPWHIDVLPASQALAAWDTDPNRLNREWRLRRALEADDSYDHVIIDCGPSLGILVVNALAAADRAVLVTEPSGASVDGLGLALQLIAEVKQQMHPTLETAGVVINAADDRERESRHFVEEVRAAFGDRCFEPPIPRRTAVRQAMSAHVPVQSITTPGAREVTSALNAIADQLDKS